MTEKGQAPFSGVSYKNLCFYDNLVGIYKMLSALQFLSYTLPGSTKRILANLNRSTVAVVLELI